MAKPFMRSAAHPVCVTPCCTNLKAVVKKKADGSPVYANYCASCRSRLWRESHPAAAAYYNLKHRAKERGKEFTITRAQFEEWCTKTGYHQLKSKNKDGMSVDRIREEDGYHIDNIQMMPLGENSRKSQVFRSSNTDTGDPTKPYTEEEDPFRS